MEIFKMIWRDHKLTVGHEIDNTDELEVTIEDDMDIEHTVYLNIDEVEELSKHLSTVLMDYTKRNIK